MVQVFKDTYEDLTPESFERILDDFAAGRTPKPGPQNGRKTSEPAGGLTTLTDPSLYNGKAARPAAKKTAAVPAKTAEAAPAQEPASKPTGPERLSKPKGKADDLKMIAGVGPKLEQTLNRLGFWHFAQIAKWTKKDIAIVDDELSFRGRIERDDWVKQAKASPRAARPIMRVFGKKPR